MKNFPPDKNLGYIEWKAWDPAKFGSFTVKDHVVFSCELRRAKISLTEASSVLEVGFGNGAFAGWVRRKTPHYVGTEINPELVTRAQQAGIDAYPATLHLDTVAKGRTFDLIAIFDVMEHLDKEEILQVLDTARGCLSGNGKLLVRVPSGDSPFSGHLMYGDITHKTQLGSLAFHQLATLTGLEVISVCDAAYPIFGLGILATVRRLAILPARKMIEAIVKAVYYANESVVMAPNLVAVLRRNPSGSPTSRKHDLVRSHGATMP